MAPKSRIATISGVLIAPGVSKNGRKYTPENIGKAVDRLQARLENDDAPTINMLTHHDAGDDTTKIVGKATKVWQDSDGAARYEADIPDTSAGRDIAALAGHGYIKNVSIRGRWVGEVQTSEDDSGVETADDMEIDGWDFTKSPGVEAAKVGITTLEATALSRGMFLESFEPVFELDVTKTSDRNTLKDSDFILASERKFPAPTQGDFNDAISSWGRYKGSTTFAQFKSAATALAKRKGFTLPKSWQGESMAKDAFKEATITITHDGTCPCGPPQPLDPDNDGDIDALQCPCCGAVTPVTDPQLNPDAEDDGRENHTKETTVSETAKEATAPKAVAETEVKEEANDIKALTEAVKALIESKQDKVEEKTEPEKTVAEQVADAVAAKVEEIKAELRKEMVETKQVPVRKGYVQLHEGAEPKAVHEMSPEEFREYEREVALTLLPSGHDRMAEPSIAQ